MRLAAIFDKPKFEGDDWMVRLGVGIFFFIFGIDKFDASPHGEWVMLFHRIGIGDWFRVFTGWVEIAGAVLAVLPRTALVGNLLLAATMACASGIWIWVVHEPGSAPIPGFLALILLLIAFVRWRAIRPE